MSEQFDDPTEMVTIQMSRESACRLARGLRMGGEAFDFLDELATSLGACLDLCTATDETDPLDEGLEAGEAISWAVYVGSDNVPFEDTITPQGA